MALQSLEGSAWLYPFPVGNKPILAQFIVQDHGGLSFTLDTYWIYVTAGGNSEVSVQPVVRDPGQSTVSRHRPIGICDV